MEDISTKIWSVLPLRNAVIFPGTTLPLKVGRAKSIAALEHASKNDQLVLALTQKVVTKNQDPEADDLYKIGTLCKIEKIRGNAEKGYHVLIRGIERVRVLDINTEKNFFIAHADHILETSDIDEKTSKALAESLKTLSREILNLLPGDNQELNHLLDAIDDPGFLSYLCASNIEIPLSKKQELLETISLKNRVLMLLDLMQHHKDALQVQTEIREKLSHKMGKIQREAFLREQLKAIQDELSESEGQKDGTDNSKNYSQKINDAQMPEGVKKVALEELKRFESIGNNSPESHIIRNYLDLLCALPWSVSSNEETDLNKARQILEDDHYGLAKIKERILQHLAVMKLKKDGKGSILLFVGPPGVGKTSLGQSIAKALGRKFVRASLGGGRDDADIRGHRKTYVGAMPGRIIQGIKRAGENNPVFILDEIDKLGRGFQGDPASALLEVLDPEQNSAFLDHYLDLPFDLSKVFFIATANSVETIPGPLLDRMEVIQLSGYTVAEKLHIAKNHLIPKILKEFGMVKEQIEISDEGVLRIISYYTREAGVRDLQRQISTVFRSYAERVLNSQNFPFKITASEIEEILGKEKFIYEVAERIVSPGVVTGLAWTPQGGEILFIEANAMPGSSKLTITGQLGEVMKESAQIALSLVRSSMIALNSGFDFEKKDLHIHVPAGAIPKDGPSAGIAMLVTIASLFSNRSVDPKLAMTGELTLRGAVMPVGGIKEKVIAAHRAGIERIILSERNKRDLDEVPDEVKSGLKFFFVKTASEVLKIALGLEVVPFEFQSLKSKIDSSNLQTI